MIKNILEYFEKTVEEHGDKVAVIDGERQITFNELAKQAQAVGTAINEISSGQVNSPIGIFLPKSIESIVADIGILYSGNAFMNLDVKTPMPRISIILNVVQPLYIITNKYYFDDIKSIYSQDKIILIEDIANYSSKVELLKEVLKSKIDTDPFCLINTSGSTGIPKSVILNHKSFIDLTDWALTNIKWNDREIMGSLVPIVFDVHIFELCMLMSNGNAIIVIPDTFAAFPVKILQLMNQHKVSYIFWVPTIMVNIANMDLLSKLSLPYLKKIWFIGEVFPTRQFNYWYKHLPNREFINLYGPIEITLACTYFVIDRGFDDNEPLPIGKPFRNTDILVLDENNNLIIEPNIEGELCVRGTSLAMGYYNNYEKTQAAFIQNPLNKSYVEIIYRTGDIVYYNCQKELVFKGRRDSLIKRLGYRIELGEIEHVIVNTLKLVNNGCAVYDFSKKEIVFFYESEVEQSIAEFRKNIGKALPNYMIPNKYIRKDILPRNTNGKIDRLKLKEEVNN